MIGRIVSDVIIVAQKKRMITAVLLIWLTVPINLVHTKTSLQDWFEDNIDLPLSHYPFFFKRNHDLFSNLCYDSPGTHSARTKNICGYVRRTGLKCWGYESALGIVCDQNDTIKYSECDGAPRAWARNKKEQEDIFFEQADFGYIKARADELTTFCRPKNTPNVSKLFGKSSSLECTKYFRFCRAKSIMIDFQELNKLPEPIKYRSDILDDGLIGGLDCDLDNSKLVDESSHKSPLQSWYEELEHYTVFSESPKCDHVITKPTFIMKLDATVNMYHHFCDFINLYASLHLNNSFSLDNQIIIWDSTDYWGNFAIVWQSFTKNPLISLDSFRGKKVCFKDAVFPFLPRMIFGLYYNMPVIPGCKRSGLFQAFNQHLLHTLDVDTQAPSDQIRITLISRKTKFRQILNEDELLSRIQRISDTIHITKAEFTHKTPFIEQIRISSNSDILIGMHGAGLTHCLFQPDWGVLFELYNCEDPNCYRDLALLRGLKYLTWSKVDKIYPESPDKPSDSGAYQKFTNYRFDPDEFTRLVSEAIEYVKRTRDKGKVDNQLLTERKVDQESVDKVHSHSEL